MGIKYFDILYENVCILSSYLRGTFDWEYMEIILLQKIFFGLLVSRADVGRSAGILLPISTPHFFASNVFSSRKLLFIPRMFNFHDYIL